MQLYAWLEFIFFEPEARQGSQLSRLPPSHAPPWLPGMDQGRSDWQTNRHNSGKMRTKVLQGEWPPDPGQWTGLTEKGRFFSRMKTNFGLLLPDQPPGL